MCAANDDVETVTRAYERCWRLSRGRHDAWVDGRLGPIARRFYVAVNAIERCLMGGVPSLLEETRFSLAETEEALASFDFVDHAAVVRALNELVGERTFAIDRRERARELNGLKLHPKDIGRLNGRLTMAQPREDGIWAKLAQCVREHPGEFTKSDEPTQAR